MITAVRYVTSSDSAPLHGAPLVRPLRIFYNLPRAEVVGRLEQALAEGREGVQVEDLAGVLCGSGIREAVLEQLFGAEVLRRAFFGTEEPAGTDSHDCWH